MKMRRNYNLHWCARCMCTS